MWGAGADAGLLFVRAGIQTGAGFKPFRMAKLGEQTRSATPRESRSADLG